MGHRKTAVRRIAPNLTRRQLLPLRQSSLIVMYEMRCRVGAAQRKHIRLCRARILTLRSLQQTDDDLIVAMETVNADTTAVIETLTAARDRADSIADLCIEAIREQRICWRSMGTNLQGIIDELGRSDRAVAPDWVPDLVSALTILKDGAHRIADAGAECEPGVHMELLGANGLDSLADDTPAPVGLDY